MLDLLSTPSCTPAFYWQPVLTYVLPPVGALLSAIALWVGSRARSTSEAALSTSREAVRRSGQVSLSPDTLASLAAARDQRKP